jgi:predicted aspartyl protease
MSLKFNFRVEKSALLGTIHRPVAQIYFWSEKGSYWTEVWAIVDTGADYTMLPRFLSEDLQIDLERDCKVYTTFGVGGIQRSYFLPHITAKLGSWTRKIPIGFLDSDEVPPLMGRHLFLETFETHFSRNRAVSFTE